MGLFFFTNEKELFDDISGPIFPISLANDQNQDYLF